MRARGRPRPRGSRWSEQSARSRLSPSQRRCVGVRTADRLARYHELDAPILLTSGRNVVRCYRLRLSEAERHDRRRRNALLHEVIAHGLRAALRQRLVVVVVADVVGVAFDLEVQAWIREQDAGDASRASRARPACSVCCAVSNSTSDMLTIRPRAVSRVSRMMFNCCCSRSRSSAFSRLGLLATAWRARAAACSARRRLARARPPRARGFASRRSCARSATRPARRPGASPLHAPLRCVRSRSASARSRARRRAMSSASARRASAARALGLCLLAPPRFRLRRARSRRLRGRLQRAALALAMRSSS